MSSDEDYREGLDALDMEYQERLDVLSGQLEDVTGQLAWEREINSLWRSWASSRGRDLDLHVAHGCTCRSAADLGEPWAVSPECEYHATAAKYPSYHAIPWNCPTYYDGCNCRDVIAEWRPIVEAHRRDCRDSAAMPVAVSDALNALDELAGYADPYGTKVATWTKGQVTYLRRLVRDALTGRETVSSAFREMGMIADRTLGCDGDEAE